MLRLFSPCPLPSHESSFIFGGNYFYLILDLLVHNPRIFTKSTYCCIMRQLVVSCHLFKVVCFILLLLKILIQSLKYLLITHSVPYTVSVAG